MKKSSDILPAPISYVDQEKQFFFPTYKRSSLIPVRGEGPYLFDEEGRQYLDLVAGLGVNALGHAHEGIRQAVNLQLGTFSHLSNGFINITQVELAAKILRLAPELKSIFFTNSGTEAVEGALKLVRRWAHENSRETIFAFSKGFHGRTLGALSLTHKEKYRQGFGPFMHEVRHLQFDSLNDLDQINSNTAAVFLEFVLGEGGVRPISCEFADKLERLHKQFGFLLVADEIQCGIGRTGQFFTYQWYTLKPDIVLAAKPIGGGLPLGAILGGEKVSGLWGPGDHGTTFGGNPVACAAGGVVIDWLSDGGFAHVQKTGKRFSEALKYLNSRYPAIIKTTRAFGLMGAIELYSSSMDYPAKALEAGLIINATDETVIRLLPPLIIDNSHIAEMIEKFDQVFGK